jgi:hypothetical protein
VADKYSISTGQAKELFQGLFDLRTFNGSRSGISMILGVEKCKKAMEDEFLAGLRSEAIRARKTVDLAKRADDSARFAYYEQLEQTVMSGIYRAATESGVRFWPFHDGLTLLEPGKRITDLNRMTRYVRD